MKTWWIIFLISDEGWWMCERWITPREDFDLVVEDLIHGLENGIIQVPEGEVITLVEVEVK